ncbi:hypothetical protein COL23_25580 [Priestia aryabhattai]|uniref:MobA/MobL family protein n=1 Tax=Priestia aryabhattai TaxID=412384 RepID=UPI000BF5DD57|nr:MobA/MobL family protein [Priestia aryabhattai]PFW72124.1 hypothetical protein COL23_25580 [Priestia aryabhattai]
MKERIYHLQINVYGRGKTHNFWQKLGYRDGGTYLDEKTGQTFNYAYKKEKDEIESELLTPEHAAPELKNRQTYYEELNKKEHAKKAQYFREFEFSLFNDLDKDENKEIARRFGQKLVDKYGMCVDLNFHKLDSENPHCHALASFRELKEDGTFGNKNREWNKKQVLKEIRKEYADIANEFFKEKNKEMFISEKSYKERGIDKLPQKHLPMKKNKEYYDTLEENKIIKKYNRRTDIVEQKKDIKEEREMVKIEFETKKVLTNSGKSSLTVETSKEREVRNMARENLSDSFMNQFEDDMRRGGQVAGRVAGKGLDVTKKVAKGTVRTLNDLLREQSQRLNNRSRELTKKQKEAKMKAVEKKKELKESRESYLDKRFDRRHKVKDLKLDNQFLKAELKGTGRLSLRDMKKRRDIKKKMRVNKLNVKRQKLAMRREKMEHKRGMREYKKERLNAYKLAAQNFKTKCQIRKLNKQMEKGKNIKLDNVVSFQEAREKKIKITKESVAAIKRNRDKGRSL